MSSAASIAAAPSRRRKKYVNASSARRASAAPPSPFAAAASIATLIALISASIESASSPKPGLTPTPRRSASSTSVTTAVARVTSSGVEKLFPSHAAIAAVSISFAPSTSGGSARVAQIATPAYALARAAGPAPLSPARTRANAAPAAEGRSIRANGGVELKGVSWR
eukprot:31245-Pelagococcus_subviridis.AAC.4